MKISVVTITRNDGQMLARTVRSIYAQELPPGVELEHIIVDGGEPNPETESILSHAAALGSRVLRSEPRGCYHAINRGLEQCTGDITGLLHGTDFYPDTKALADVADSFADGSTDFIFADVVYTDCDSHTGCVKPGRLYSSRNYSPSALLHGFAPPHPTLYMRTALMKETGPYCEDYIISADFEYFLRLFRHVPALKWRRLDRVLVAMDKSGASASWKNRLTVNVPEKMRALRDNGLKAGWLNMLLRYYYHFRNR